MHEQSIVVSLLRQVGEILINHGVQVARDADESYMITEVRVAIGPLSGVEPLLLQSAFEQLAPGSIARGAQLAIEERPLRFVCKSCRHSGVISQYDFRCPQCQSGVRIVEGDAIELISVSFATPETTADLPS